MEGLRLAVIGTPRTGSTWLSRLLMELYDLSQVAWWTPEEVDWANLPERTLLHAHFPCDESTQHRLHDSEFHVVTTCRHPLDIALSLLRGARSAPPLPKYVNDADLRGVAAEILDPDRHEWTSPRSDAFLRWATGPRFTSLLAISRDWWQAPDAAHVRYEDLFTQPAVELAKVANAVSSTRARTIEEAVAQTTDDKVRYRTNPWGTDGSPDGWKRFFTAGLAKQIAEAQKDTFEVLGYACDASAQLSEDEADLNWYKADAASSHNFAIRRAELVNALQSDLNTQQERIVELSDRVVELSEKIAAYEGVGPSSLELARRMTTLRVKWPFVASVARPFVRLLRKRTY